MPERSSGHSEALGSSVLQETEDRKQNILGLGFALMEFWTTSCGIWGFYKLVSILQNCLVRLVLGNI